MFGYQHGLLCFIPYVSPTLTISCRSVYKLKISEQAAAGDWDRGRPVWNVSFVAKTHKDSVTEHLQSLVRRRFGFIFQKLAFRYLDLKA